MSFYVKGTEESKWKNPFRSKSCGRNKCLELYEEYIRNTPELYNSLGELEYKEDVLIKLFQENL